MLFSLLSAIGLTAIATSNVSHPSLHPLHLSRSLVEYFPEEKAIRVSLNIFLDDLEEALGQSYPRPLRLGSPGELAGIHTLLEAYFRKHFTFTLDGRPSPLHLLGKELSDDQQSLWCYLEISATSPPEKIKVNCTLLTEVFRDQRNILHFAYPGVEGQSFLLARNRTEAVFVKGK